MVKNLPPKNLEKMPDNPREWVLDFYMQRRAEKSIFKRLTKINFEEEKVVGAGRDSDIVMISSNSGNNN